MSALRPTSPTCLTRLIALLCLAFLASRLFAAEPDTVTVDPDTEAVIHGALNYLAKQQSINGSWTQAPGSNAYPVAMTGYALMAFMSAGNLPGQGEYGRNVTSGMQYLINQIQPDGLFRDVDQGRYMYSHGIATIALCELYGEAPSQLLRARLSQLIAVIVNGQSPVGGWRYKPASQDSDISVTVLQVAALRAAKNAGLTVPQLTIDRANDFIERCYSVNDGGFAYQPDGPSGFARTAAAVYSLQVCGRYDDPGIKTGSDYILAHDNETEPWWPYGCYYAAPAEYMIGGDTWPKWYDQIRTKLLSTVIREGDTDYWDAKRSPQLGPIYDTAVFTTVLAMPWHYLPLYQR
jgi:hypothetical protein